MINKRRIIFEIKWILNDLPWYVFFLPIVLNIHLLEYISPVNQDKSKIKLHTYIAFFMYLIEIGIILTGLAYLIS